MSESNVLNSEQLKAIFIRETAGRSVAHVRSRRSFGQHVVHLVFWIVFLSGLSIATLTGIRLILEAQLASGLDRMIVLWAYHSAFILFWIAALLGVGFVALLQSPKRELVLTREGARILYDAASSQRSG
jgi:hypothetical protein